MRRVADKYIDIWLEQVRRERNRNPADGAQIDFGTWESMLVELSERRARDLTREDLVTLSAIRCGIEQDGDSWPESSAQTCRAFAVLDKVMASAPQEMTE